MRSMTTTVLAAVLVTLVHPVAAQQPRPNEPARTVTLALGEYNRLIDLANRPSSNGSAAPVGAVLASAELRVRVERDTARGVFVLTGDVLRAGVNKLTVLSGAT